MKAPAMSHEELTDFILNFTGPAHCFSAWIKGKGYVNKGETVESRPDYERQLGQRKRSEAENIGYASDYAEPGYDSPKHGILFADWNPFPSNLPDALENLGYSIEWSDEWATCEDCNKAFRTEPDSYDWKPAGTITENGAFCNACVSEEEETA